MDEEGLSVDKTLLQIQDWLQFLSESRADLLECGSAVLYLLDAIYQELIPAEATATNLTACSENAAALLKLADDRILAFNYKSVPTFWRRLYTDATILEIISHLLNHRRHLKKFEPNESQIDWREDSIRKLDMTIIIAGAPGPQRRDIVFGLLGMLQEHYTLQYQASRSGSPAERSTLPRSRKKQKVDSHSSLKPESQLPFERHQPPYLDRPLPNCSSDIAISEFRNLIKEGPFIIRGGCKDWDACHKWRSLRHIMSIAGQGRVVPVEVGDNYTSEGWGQKIMLFKDFIATLGHPYTSSDYDDSSNCANGATLPSEKLYLAQHDLFSQLPGLRNDLTVPDWIYSAPDPPSHAVDSYVPLLNGEGFIMNAWLGPESTTSPAHTDPYFNCYAQVVGSKWIWLASPASTPHMYTFEITQEPSKVKKSRLENPEGEVIKDEKAVEEDGEPKEEDHDDDEHQEGGSASHLMVNTSRIDVSQPIRSKGLHRFPSYVKHVLPESYQDVLEPGDLLFIPPGWWHSMKSLETSFSVSFWF